MPKIDTLYTTCVNASARSIRDMCDNSRQITFDTFFRHVDLKYVSKMLGYNYRGLGGKGLSIRDDYHLSYFKSKFQGRPCFYLVWSSIEYVFCVDNN